jgi:hypothetical protein
MVPTVGPGGVCIWRGSGVRRSVLCCCVWRESAFGRREDVFTLNLPYKDIFINVKLPVKFAINCITVKRSTYLLLSI